MHTGNEMTRTQREAHQRMLELFAELREEMARVIACEDGARCLT